MVMKFRDGLIVALALVSFWLGAYLALEQEDTPQDGWMIVCFDEGKSFSNDLAYEIAIKGDTWRWHSLISNEDVMAKMTCAAAHVDAAKLATKLKEAIKARDIKNLTKRERFGPGLETDYEISTLNVVRDRRADDRLVHVRRVRQSGSYSAGGYGDA